MKKYEQPKHQPSQNRFPLEDKILNGDRDREVYPSKSPWKNKQYYQPEKMINKPICTESYNKSFNSICSKENNYERYGRTE